jgi:hypothetical protein
VHSGKPNSMGRDWQAFAGRAGEDDGVTPALSAAGN